MERGGRADAKKACHGAYQKAMRKTQVAALRAAVPADRYHIALLWNRFFSFAVAFRSSCADRSVTASFIRMKRKRNKKIVYGCCLIGKTNKTKEKKKHVNDQLLPFQEDSVLPELK